MVAAGSLSACATASGVPAPVEFRNGMGSASYGELGVLTPSELNGPMDPRSLPDTVMVEPGQTLFDISRRYQTPLDAIIAENRLRPPYALEVGQILQLPDANVYTVRRGETFWTVAEKFSIDPHSFATLNRLSKPYALMEGQEVVLPAGATAKTAAVQRTPAQKARSGARVASAPPPSVSQAPIDTPAGRFIWPVSGKMLQGFGPMANGQRSDGLKIAAPEGAPIRAADAGSVVYAGDDLPGYGNLVLVKHEGGWITAYANARRILVKEGAKVAKGDVIAEVGATGRANQAGLHFELRKGPRPVDPLPALPKA
jgi:murein DD-endopeptidase MepM/ murein hydrolase activator NlpD